MTLLPAHVGMRVRLTEKVSPQHGLVQEAEGTIVDIVPDPQESLSSADTEVLLKYAPRCFWVLFDKCSNAPLANAVKDLLPKAFDEAPWTHTRTDETEKAQPGEPPLPPLRQRLVFVGAVQRTFKRELAGTKWTVTRRQVPLASALDRTVQSSQGLTFRKGVLADLGCLAGANRDDHWLSVYVMLSRATSLDDPLLLRLPDLSFFDQGPPPYLREFLETLHRAGGPLQEAREEGFGLADLATIAMCQRACCTPQDHLCQRICCTVLHPVFKTLPLAYRSAKKRNARLQSIETIRYYNITK